MSWEIAFVAFVFWVIIVMFIRKKRPEVSKSFRIMEPVVMAPADIAEWIEEGIRKWIANKGP